MTATAPPTEARGTTGDRYKWTVLGNTTLGNFMAMIDVSITLVALPDIFRGIHLDPLSPGNSFYLLWMVLGYLVVTSVLLVSLGRLGDMHGRVRMYNIGFAGYTVFSLLLTVTWMTGPAGAMWLIVMRLFQAAGAAFLLSNSSAIVTDAFPPDQRGMALGLTNVAAVTGSFVGLLLGGLLGPPNWRLIFLVSVPAGLVGTVWGFVGLKERGTREATRVDWAGNATFAAGVLLLVLGVTYGIEPHGSDTMGWTGPWVLAELSGGAALMVAFVLLELRVQAPMFAVRLFKVRAFAAATTANFCAAMGRGGLMFLIVIWLQGVWLPLHGYDFSETPLWAAVHMVPFIAGLVSTGPVSGYLTDRVGARPFAMGGMAVAAACFVWMALLPYDFSYPEYAVMLFVMGAAQAAFISPNRAATMSTLAVNERGAGSGMMATAQSVGQVLAIGTFFTLMIVGLSSGLPAAMQAGLTAHGVPAATALRLSRQSPVSLLFAAFLGYNPLHSLLGAKVLSGLSHTQAAALTSHVYFPRLIGRPLNDGIRLAASFGAATSVVAGMMSWRAGGKVVQPIADLRPAGGTLVRSAGASAGGITVSAVTHGADQ